MQGVYHFSYQSKLRMREMEDDVEKVRRLKGLPRNLHLPYEIQNPWMRSTFEEDFILITEFSENEGPREVLTIPSGGGGSFDKNAFALQVMSVDFQSQNRTAEFNIAEDTQLFLTDKTTGICAFVHHFTLNDIHARGYVRPFCMSYIAHSKRKILTRLSSIIKEFQKIAKLFHVGNRAAFSDDLKQRLGELFSLNEQFHWNSESKTCETQAENRNHEIYHQTFCETKKIIEALKPHMSDSAVLDKLKKLENQADHQKHNLLTESHEKDEMPFKSEENQDCPELPAQDGSIRRAQSLPSIYDLKTAEDSKMPSFKTFAPAYLNNVKQLRHLHELCGFGAKEGINQLRNVIQYFSQEEIALAVEKTEASLIDPSTSLLTLGKSVVLNFTSNVDFKKIMNVSSTGKQNANQMFISLLHRRLSLGSAESACSTDSFKSCLEDMAFDSRRSSDGMLSRFIPSSSLHVDFHGDDCDTFDSDTTPETPSSEITTLQFDDSLSLGSYHILDDNCLQRQMSEMHINEHLEPHKSFVSRKSHSLENLPSMTKYSEPYSNSNDGEIRSSSFARVTNMCADMSLGIKEMKTSDVSHHPDDEKVVRKKKKMTNILVGKALSRNHKTEMDNSGNCTPQKPGNNSRKESVLVRCYAEQLCKTPDPQTVASSILEFRNNYSIGVHLIYALLIARPVVILAKPDNEKEVRALISTLWMFVSDIKSCQGRAVIPWRKKALHITDLPCLRLVGLCKSRRGVLPKSVERYVSVLDYETGIIASPPYKGLFLKAVFSYKNCWPSNTTLLAFIHSIFLELACKAYVLYYSCSLGPALLQSKSAMDAKFSMDEIEVLNRLGVHFSDAAIVQHFVEIIKKQQIDSHSHGNEELKAQAILSDLSKCAKYRNLAPFES